MYRRIVKGLAAGYLATAVMTSAQTEAIPAVSRWLQSLRGGRGAPEQKSSGNQEEDEESGSQAEQESSPALVARRAGRIVGFELSHEEAMRWGNRIHWLFGTQWGVVYLLLRSRPGPASGLLFGSALWLGSDELMLWAMGIAKAPTSYPISSHLKALAAHLAFGVTLGTVARGLCASMNCDSR